MRTKEELHDTLEYAREIFPEDITVGINDSVEDWPFVYAGSWSHDAKYHPICRISTNGERYEVNNMYTCFAAGSTPQQIIEQRELMCFLSEKPLDQQSLVNILQNMKGWSEPDE